MRIRVLNRDPEEYTRETKKDIQKIHRNYDSKLHPFEMAREYTRALNSAKLERVFAKPFMGDLAGHSDTVNALSCNPADLSTLVTGSFDGEIFQWNVSHRKCLVASREAHQGCVYGLCFGVSGEYFFSCGSDSVINQWRVGEECPTRRILSKDPLLGMDHHRKSDVFVSCGDVISLWDEDRDEPLREYSWGVDSVDDIKFNPTETDLVAAVASDRSLSLYDIRTPNPLRKITTRMRSNRVCWNPMEPFMLTVANEDFNLHTFDMRNLGRPYNVHMGHVAAVMDVDYSPTGREFVSAGYDKSIRIFEVNSGSSREIYHCKRMQKLFRVKWSLDGKFVFSTSEETNVRIWKANAAEKLGIMKPREKIAHDYGQSLKDKFKNFPQVGRIIRHRHIPRLIYSAAKENRAIRAATKRKERNRRLHSRPGTVPIVTERMKHVVKEEE